MKPLGRHLIAELYGCRADRLDDLDTLRRALYDAADAIGATCLGDRFHRFTPQGVSGTVLIAESHLGIHTWPEHGYAAFDVFTCGDLDPAPAAALIAARLDAAEVRQQTIERGLIGDALRGPDDVALRTHTWTRTRP
ncbi:MAG: adenosylmethionine decarboxylase [Acidobacteriota bacterium]